MDLCGNWMDSFENKTKRRLRPRETKEDQKDDSNPSSAVSENLIKSKICSENIGKFNCSWNLCTMLWF